MPTQKQRALIELFFKTRRLIIEHTKSADRPDIGTLLQLQVLRFISEQDHPFMKDLACHLCITPPSTTSLIKSMEKNKLIMRATDKKDRRHTRLELTPKGKKVLTQGTERMIGKISQVLSHLNNKELEAFTQILTKLSSVYEKEE